MRSPPGATSSGGPGVTNPGNGSSIVSGSGVICGVAQLPLPTSLRLSAISATIAFEFVASERPGAVAVEQTRLRSPLRGPIVGTTGNSPTHGAARLGGADRETWLPN